MGKEKYTINCFANLIADVRVGEILVAFHLPELRENFREYFARNTQDFILSLMFC